MRSEQKRLVLDANILIRASFAGRPRDLIGKYREMVVFYSPEACFVDAREHLPKIALKRHANLTPALGSLKQLTHAVETVDESAYREYEFEARMRISGRDPDDWPIVATSLLLDCPVWTEDQDFFGSGIATWTTNNVERYLRQA